MKRSIKAAALATALALSGGAWAATSDLIIDIHDPLAAGTTTAPSDIYVDVSAYLTTAGSTLTFNLSSLSTWTTFFNAADAASLQFVAVGLTQTGITRQGDIAFSPSAPAAPSASIVTSIAGGSNHNLLTDLSVLGVAAPVVGSSAVSPNATGTSSSPWANIVGPLNDFGAAQGPVVGTAASPLTLYYFSTAAARTTIGTIALNLGTTDTITVGTAAAVPEPGTYALMAAGLLAVGAIVRRRARS